MLCQRCGHCCISMWVIVPVQVEEEIRACVKPAGQECPNLSFDDEMMASCSVHNLPEFRNSPCWVYGNSEVDPDFYLWAGKPCQVGESYRSKGGVSRCPKVNEVKDAGPWIADPND